jgi:hypothetical protein
MGFESRHQHGEHSREDLAESLAQTHGLELARSREVLRRAEQAAAEDPLARSVRQWFAILVDDTRTETVGKRTGLQSPGTPPTQLRDPAKHAPGRQTLVMREGWNEDSQASPPRLDESRRTPQHLDIATQWRMSQALGFDFSGVSIRPDSPEATGSTRAVVKDGDVHFREGAYQPGTHEGDWLIAHELTHIVQQHGGRGEQAGSRHQLEREADRAASLAVRGHTASIGLRAQSSMAYAFDESEPHHGTVDEVVDGKTVEDHEENAVEAGGSGHVSSEETHSGVRLKETLIQATAGAPERIPFQPELERFFGRPLPLIDAFTGRGELGQLGARGAAVGRTVVFAESAPELHVVAHEVAHALQQEHTSSSARRLHELADEEAPAEHEADAAARAIASGDPAVFAVRERPAPIVHLNRDRRPFAPTGPIHTDGIGFSQARIRGTPQKDVVAGSNVRYEVVRGPEIMSQGSYYSYAWKCINDPTTRGNAPAEVAGPRTHRWNAHWDFGGQHKIVCTVQFHPAGETPRAPQELAFWQQVISLEEVQQEKDDEAMLRLLDPTALRAPATSPALTPGSTSVTPEVAAQILENMAKNQPPFKPELGKGGCSWFISEGNPYTGIDPVKNVDLPVEINRTANPVIFDEAKLDALFKQERAKLDMAEIEGKYRQHNKLPPDQALNSKARKAIERLAAKAAESKMWDQVAAEVKQSSAKVGEVILENSAFSKSGNGKFLVVADASKIQVKGGMSAVVNALEASGSKVEPVVAEAVERTAARLKWAGRVRGAFRYGGRILIVVAVASDVYRIYHAQDKVKTVVETVGGWAGASMAAAGFSTVFAPADTAGPWAWAAHGVGVLIAGGIGYWTGSSTTRTIYEIIVEES